ncbi:MAG: FG-GAP-like repeat-containing protein [Candidatus Sulfotelmatobacter sp.]
MALAQTAVPVINLPLSPDFKVPGSAQFTLTVNGTGFASGAAVKWNGTSLTTTFVSSSKLTAVVPATDLAKAETARVTVSNGTGLVSNPANFQVVKGGYTAAFSKLDYATDLTPQDVATADFNGDGQLDLAVPTGNNTVSILLGTGTGSFSTHVEYPVPAHPIAIAVGDFNGDGKIDLAMVAGYQSQISILLGNGDGTFQAYQNFATGSHPSALAVADVNGDGKLDIVVANYNGETVSVLLGNGDGTFQAHVDYATGNGPSGVAIGDFNGDGKLDLVVANNTDNTASILLGNGDGTFQAPATYATAINPNSVVVGDFNGDGFLDLAVGTSNKSVSVLLGNGNGTFQNHKEYGIGANAVVVATADMNSDGKLDLISANYSDNTVSTLIGNGDGTFKVESVFLTNSGPAGVAIGDFNDNGKLDIAVPATNGNVVSVLTDTSITLSPTILPFATETSGFPSAAKSVTVKNSGTTAYTMGTISFGGSYYTDFSQTNNCPVPPATLAVGGTCVFSIVFDPTASEVANAQMLITATSGSVIGIQMTGQGNIPILMNPRNITFPGFQLIGTTSAPQKTTFTNESGVPITLTSLVLQGADPTEFSQTTTCPNLLGNNPGGTLAAGASCTSELYFIPTQSGLAQVTWIYSGNWTVGEAGTLVSGNGTAIKVSPLTLTFPSTAVGSSSAPKNVTFQNAGSTTLAISSINFVNGTGACWSQTNTCGFPNGSVPANSSCTISVTFTPQATGACTATMNIGDPDPTGPQMVKLSGTGTAAAGSAVVTGNK